MNLRRFAVCDKNGVKTEPSLELWDEDLEVWKDIPLVVCAEWDQETLTKRP